MTTGFEWDIDPERAFSDGMSRWERAVHDAVFKIAQFYAPQIESWMKQNAIWTDRTSNARQTLWAVADQNGRTIVIEFGYGVFYGKYLEFKNKRQMVTITPGQWQEYSSAGKYAIIAPALDHWKPIIEDAVQKLLK